MVGMVKKEVEEIVNEYINNSFIITEIPSHLDKLSMMMKFIEQRGDLETCKELKHHCDNIDENLFSSILKGLNKEIVVDEGKINDLGKDTHLDNNLIKELEVLIKHNMAISLGFFYDKKHNLRLNNNKCITYLQQMLECVVSDNELMVFNRKEGIYERLTDELLGTILRYLMNLAIEDSWRKYYEKDISDGLYREVPRINNSNMDDSLVAVNNGIFNLKTNELISYNGELFFTTKSPINYDSKSQCPKFLKALNDIVCKDNKLLECIQEIFGYVLINNVKGERAFYFTGVGSNGKSFLADILSNIVGESNVSNIPLSKFSENFGTEGIINKTLNIANENEVGSAISTENLKGLVSGDRTNIPRKYKGGLDYRSTCKMIFLLNTLPDTLDNTHGYYRKILIVPFNRVFKQEEMDKDLKNKVSKEYSGILNWAIEGAQRLIKNKYTFTECESIKKITKKYKEEQNPVESFLKEVLINEYGCCEKRKDILDSYKVWIEGQNISARGTDSPQKFWKALSNSAKVALNKELEYKKVKGILYLKDFKIDYSKLPPENKRYTFI